jgi:hypothetical protein
MGESNTAKNGALAHQFHQNQSFPRFIQNVEIRVDMTKTTQDHRIGVSSGAEDFLNVIKKPIILLRACRLLERKL